MPTSFFFFSPSIKKKIPAAPPPPIPRVPHQDSFLSSVAQASAANSPPTQPPTPALQPPAAPYKHQHAAPHAPYLALDNDRLLKAFRIEPIDDQHPETAAPMRGPFQSAPFNPPRDLSKDRLTLPSSLK